MRTMSSLAYQGKVFTFGAFLFVLAVAASPPAPDQCYGPQWLGKYLNTDSGIEWTSLLQREVQQFIPVIRKTNLSKPNGRITNRSVPDVQQANQQSGVGNGVPQLINRSVLETHNAKQQFDSALGVPAVPNRSLSDMQQANKQSELVPVIPQANIGVASEIHQTNKSIGVGPVEPQAINQSAPELQQSALQFENASPQCTWFVWGLIVVIFILLGFAFMMNDLKEYQTYVSMKDRLPDARSKLKLYRGQNPKDEFGPACESIGMLS